jgi:hypothetical protein
MVYWSQNIYIFMKLFNNTRWLIPRYNRWTSEFDLRRRKWVLLNRFRTSQGKCAFLMHRCGFSNATNCDCGHPCQTMDHIIDDCPIHAFEDGLLSLYEATPEAIQYCSTCLTWTSICDAIKYSVNSSTIIRLKKIIQFVPANHNSYKPYTTKVVSTFCWVCDCSD